ncbi:MAG: IclR family transcriptional regulator [Ilumatobacteraceae bacterium]
MSTVQSIDRAFSVLRALVPGAAGVTDIAERVGLPKSTVSRLLSTLEELGAVEQVEVGGNYRIGTAMVELASAAQPARTLIAAARPQMLELARITGESTGLSVADGTDMLYLDQVNPDTELQVRDWTGARIPMHAVPSGQVVLAAGAPSVVEQYLSGPLEQFTEHTVVGAAALRRRLVEVRTEGYAWAVEEFADGLSSVAAPVHDTDGIVVGALHVYGPTYRLPGERDPHDLGVIVAECAARIRID